jgi:hypothetical protein
LSDPWPTLPEEYYLDAKATGDRSRFEAIYFKRRSRMGRFAILAILDPQESAWRTALLDCFRQVLHEESWALPAHVSSPSGKDPWHIDLFAAETAVMLADFCAILREKIPAELVDALRERLRMYIWENYLSAADDPDAHRERFYWLNIESNWNAVCHHGVIGSALSLCEDPELLAGLVNASAKFLPYFLKGFTEDGGCTEGPSYWTFGFGRFAWLNSRLESRTNGELSYFGDNPKITRMAEYFPPFSIDGRKVINFSDCPPEHPHDPALFFYLSQRLNLPNLGLFGLKALRVNAEARPDGAAARANFFSLARQIVFLPAKVDVSLPRTEPEINSRFFPELGVWISRGLHPLGIRWVLGAKGGHNAEHHNHNDVGSFVLFLNEISFLSEIGAPAYNRQFFGPERYHFLATRSFGHSVPLIASREQYCSHMARGLVKSAEFGTDTDKFILDIAGAYPTDVGVQQALRSILWNHSNLRFTLRDEISLQSSGQPTESALMTFLDPVPDGNGVRLECSGLTLILQPGAHTRYRGHSELEFRDFEHRPAFVNRLVFECDSAHQDQASFAIEILGNVGLAQHES